MMYTLIEHNKRLASRQRPGVWAHNVHILHS